MTAEALWRSTALEFEALTDRYLAHQREQQVMWARQAAITFNLGRPEQAKQVADFMPDGSIAEAPRNPKHEAYAAEMAFLMIKPLREEDVPDWAKRPSIH